MSTDQLLHIIQSLMAQPTAPFCEDSVRSEILQQLGQCPHVSVKLDSYGNVIARYQRGNREPRWVLSAHMDHPGFVGEEFMGGVPPSYLAKNPPRRDFGSFSMWDLPPFVLRDGLIFSRACDDLIGCAVMVAMFRELESQNVETAVTGVFTCAEEVGLLGAVYIAKSGILPAGIGVLSLETSSERPPAKMNDGVIIRVGDRTSVFDSERTGELVSQAVTHSILHQRCLMSGGTCEATAYRLYGYPVAGVCVALGNYHNCAPDGTIAPEFVSVKDVQTMFDLCVQVAKSGEPEGRDSILRARLESELEKSYKTLNTCKPMA